MVVECQGGPLDGLILTTSLPPSVKHFWIDGKRRRCYRSEGRRRHLYRVEHLDRMAPRGDVPVVLAQVSFAAFTERICDGCGVYHLRTDDNCCTLCGGVLRSVVQEAV